MEKRARCIKMIGRIITIWERILIFLVAFAVTAWFLISIKVWQTDLARYFLLTDRWIELIFVGAVVYLIVELIARILKWQVRKSFEEPLPGEKPQIKRRRG